MSITNFSLFFQTKPAQGKLSLYLEDNLVHQRFLQILFYKHAAIDYLNQKSS